MMVGMMDSSLVASMVDPSDSWAEMKVVWMVERKVVHLDVTMADQMGGWMVESMDYWMVESTVGPSDWWVEMMVALMAEMMVA